MQTKHWAICMLCAVTMLGLGIDLRVAYIIFPSIVLIIMCVFGVAHNDISDKHSW